MATLNSSEPITPPSAWINVEVSLHGLVGAASLNGRTGLVKSYADGRYVVSLKGGKTSEEGLKVVKVRLCNLAKLEDQNPTGRSTPQQPLSLPVTQSSVPPTSSNNDENDSLALSSAPLSIEPQQTNTTTSQQQPPPKMTEEEKKEYVKKRPRPAFMTGRPGEYKLGYDWREVLEGQSVPPGLEIRMSLGEDLPKIARIPCQWRCKVEVRANNNNVEDFRIDVTRETKVCDILEALYSKYPEIGRERKYWRLIVGSQIVEDYNLSVEQVKLFGSKIIFERR